MSAAAETVAVKILMMNSLAGALLGEGGKSKNELQEVSGARVIVSKQTELYPGTSDRVILITGEEEAVSQACTYIIAMIATFAKGEEDHVPRTSIVWSPRALTDGEFGVAINDDVEIVLRLTVPEKAGGILLGRGGVTIKSICESSGAHVLMSDKQDAIFTHERILTFSGTAGSCTRAAGAAINKLCESKEAYLNRGTVYGALTALPMQQRAAGGGGGGGYQQQQQYSFFDNALGDGRRSGGGRGNGRTGGGRSRDGADASGAGAAAAMFEGNTQVSLQVPDELVGGLVGAQVRTEGFFLCCCFCSKIMIKKMLNLKYLLIIFLMSPVSFSLNTNSP